MVEDLITQVLQREGWPEYTNDPVDRGGPTKGGITLKTLERYRKRPCTAADVEALEETEVRAIYEQLYFDQYGWVADEWLFVFLVDTDILQGPGDAIRLLQRGLRVRVDGVVGPKTLNALHAADLKALRPRFVEERIHLLLDDMVARLSHELVQTSNLKYRHGWVRRAFSFL